MASFPDEILCHIFSFLRLRVVFMHLRPVCKQWRRLSMLCHIRLHNRVLEPRLLWGLHPKPIYILIEYIKEQLPNEEIILDMVSCRVTDKTMIRLQSLGNLKGIKLTHAGITDAGIAQLTNIKMLSLTDMGKLTDEGLRNLVEKNPSIEALEITNCDKITANGISLFTNLKSLYYWSDIRVDDADIRKISEQLTHLQSLQLNLWSATDAALASFYKLRDLERLDLRQMAELTDAGVAHLGDLTSLTALTLSNCNSITDNGLSFLRALTRVRTLKLKFLEINGSGFEHIRSPLTKLVIVGCDELNDAGIEHLHSQTALRKLKLNENGRVSNSAICALLEHTPNLQELDLNGSESTDEGLAHIAEHLPNLTSIDVSVCAHVTPQGIKLLRERIPRLRKVESSWSKLDVLVNKK